MSAKVSIFIVVVALLWTSLQSPVQIHFSKDPEAKFVATTVDNSIKAGEDFIWKKSPATDRLSYENPPHQKVYTFCETLKNTVSYTPNPVKFYLRFRVLRN